MHKLLHLALFFGVLSLNAQFGKNCELRQWKINAFNPGIEYEQGIGVNTTINARAAFQLALDPAEADPLATPAFFPSLVLQTRYYHNLERRFEKGKQAFGNSANYIAPTAAVFAAESRAVNNMLVEGAHGYAGLVYGIQRTLESGLSFSIDAGAAYYVGPFEGGIYPVLNFSLGWVVSEKRWCVGR